MDEESSEEEEKPQVAKSKQYTVDDIMSLGSKLNISKKKKNTVPVQENSKFIKKEKKKRHAKKSQKIVKF